MIRIHMYTHPIQLTAYLQKGKAAEVDGEGGSGSTLLQPFYHEKQVAEESSSKKEAGEEEREKGEGEGGRGEENRELEGAGDEDVFLPTNRPVQKNKKRCWACKVKLELAQRELGGCKCGEWPQ